LLRRKFFTFISLFGISFTLMILLVVYAFYDHTVGPHTPEKRIDRLLFIDRMNLLYKDGGQSNSSPSYAFLERYVRPMKTPEKISISSSVGATVAFIGNQKLELNEKYTDGEFWQVLDFKFLAGRPYTVREVKEGAHVIVLNESTSRQYFGTVTGVVGRTFETFQKRYQVVGVVQDVPAMRYHTYSDIWMPITTSVQDIHSKEYMGSAMAILLSRSAADVPTMQQEYRQIVARVPVPDPKVFSAVRTHAESVLGAIMRNAFNYVEEENGVGRFAAVALGLAFLFMLLPALNLVNINVSRILERSSEIGVRKAFGATAGTLISQFLVENIFLTLLGGLLGLVLAAGALNLLNTSGFIAYASLMLNWRVFLCGLLASLVFGVLSGVYPAYKMSKLQAVKALKGGSN
jgi:putative ABC transport system permease protein